MNLSAITPSNADLPDAPVTIAVLTGSSSGAVAIIQLQGQGTLPMLAKLTGKAHWPTQRAMLVDFADIDHGLAFVWNNQWAQLMPHGGPRVVGQLLEKLTSLGAMPAGHTNHASSDLAQDVLQLYPEAANAFEAHMLATIAEAASPAAVDRLLMQPVLWAKWLETAREFEDTNDRIKQQVMDAILQRSKTLDRLIHPPTVVIAGRPNVGKSTLTNAMLGRSASVVADLPGTTRDWVAGMTQLPTSMGLLAVRWLDTPGVRQSDDVIEQQAIAMSQQVIQQADVVVALCDPKTPWPDDFESSQADAKTGAPTATRKPDLWVMNKADTLDESHHNAAATAGDGQGKNQGDDALHPLHISAAKRDGLENLSACISRKLLAADTSCSSDQDGLWAFCSPLRHALATSDLQVILAMLQDR